MSKKKLNPAKIEEFAVGKVEYASISIFAVETSSDTMYNAIIDFAIKQDPEHESFVTCLVTQILTEHFSEAVYNAFRVCSTFTSSIVDTIQVFNKEATHTGEASLREILEEIEASVTQVPKGATIH